MHLTTSTPVFHARHFTPNHLRCDPLVELLDPWRAGSAAGAIDSTVLRARGGVWHKKDREAGKVPHSSIDTEAHWTKSGWHGWVYGWKLHLVVTVAAVWIPLAAELTPANAADNEVAPHLLPELPPTLRFLLGDTAYDDPALHEQCAATDRLLVTTKRGAYPHTDDGVEVRRVLHQLRFHSIENFNEVYKALTDLHGQVPPAACAPPAAMFWAPSSSTNCCCSTARAMAAISGSGSKPACGPPEH